MSQTQGSLPIPKSHIIRTQIRCIRFRNIPLAEPGSENKHQLILPTPKVLCKHNSFGVIKALLGRRSRVRSWFLTFRMLTVVGCQAPNLFQRIGVGGGGLAQCPVGCGAFVVSCPRRVGDLILCTSSGCLVALIKKLNDKKQR